MPNYLFKCLDCTHELEHRQSITKDLPTFTCTECGALMQQVYHPPSMIQFETPGSMVLNWMNENYGRTKAGKPELSPDKVVKIGANTPQKNYHNFK